MNMFLICQLFQYIVEFNNTIQAYQSSKVESLLVLKSWPILYIEIGIVGNVTNHSPPFTCNHCTSCKSPAEGDHFESIFTFTLLVMPTNHWQRATILNPFSHSFCW